MVKYPMKKAPLFLLLGLLLTLGFITVTGQDKQLPSVCLSEPELDLYKLVNQYRQERGLDPVPLSKSLTYVAQLHVRDLADNRPYSRRCNLHSWSDRGPWSPCCYTEDHKRAACMWQKPSELTNYRSEGYEIAYWTDEPLSPLMFAMKALSGWKNSPDHNVVILNAGKWKNHLWKAMGIGVFGGYAAIWFGEEDDPEGSVAGFREQASHE
jgi:hypothetical protein